MADGDKKKGSVPVKNDEIGDVGDEGLWHAVDFKFDCPHVFDGAAMVAAYSVRRVLSEGGCSVCSDPRENWYCLKCAERFCGRYIKGHAKAHFDETSHPYFLSFVDLSVWCYKCDQYILSELLMPLVNEVHLAKFGVKHPQYKGNIGFVHDDKDEKKEKEKPEKPEQ